MKRSALKVLPLAVLGFYLALQSLPVYGQVANESSIEPSLLGQIILQDARFYLDLQGELAGEDFSRRQNRLQNPISDQALLQQILLHETRYQNALLREFVKSSGGRPRDSGFSLENIVAALHSDSLADANLDGVMRPLSLVLTKISPPGELKRFAESLAQNSPPQSNPRLEEEYQSALEYWKPLVANSGRQNNGSLNEQLKAFVGITKLLATLYKNTSVETSGDMVGILMWQMIKTRIAGRTLAAQFPGARGKIETALEQLPESDNGHFNVEVFAQLLNHLEMIGRIPLQQAATELIAVSDRGLGPLEHTAIQQMLFSPPLLDLTVIQARWIRRVEGKTAAELLGIVPYQLREFLTEIAFPALEKFILDPLLTAFSASVPPNWFAEQLGKNVFELDRATREIWPTVKQDVEDLLSHEIIVTQADVGHLVKTLAPFYANSSTLSHKNARLFSTETISRPMWGWIQKMGARLREGQGPIPQLPTFIHDLPLQLSVSQEDFKNILSEARELPIKKNDIETPAETQALAGGDDWLEAAISKFEKTGMLPPVPEIKIYSEVEKYFASQAAASMIMHAKDPAREKIELQNLQERLENNGKKSLPSIFDLNDDYNQLAKLNGEDEKLRAEFSNLTVNLLETYREMEQAGGRHILPTAAWQLALEKVRSQRNARRR